jgi:hypothetical protein
VARDATFDLANLRHLYAQMLVPGSVVDTASAARGLLGPAIEAMERLLAERDRLARWKAAAEATLRDWQTAADEADDGIAGWGVEDWMTNFEARLRLAAPPASTPPAG